MLRDVELAADCVRRLLPRAHAPRVAVVLGSGLAPLADAFEDATSVPYERITGMVASTVVGHPGRLVCGTLHGVPVVAMQGRIHPYEGHSLAQVVLGVRVMAQLGARTLVVTNAAGGVDASLAPGSLLVISDHINLSGLNCLIGPNDAELGPRFPDMSEAYDAGLRALAHETAQAEGIALGEGIYAGVLGPSYETPAEVRMLRMMGASAVGMSTVQEVIAARHLGLKVLGFSCVTNLAAGLSPTPLSHREVEETALRSSSTLTRLVAGVIKRLV